MRTIGRDSLPRDDGQDGVPVDPVTSLHRLGAGGPSLPRVLAVAAATSRRVALLHMCFDQFEEAIAGLDGPAGDLALAALAQRLEKAMPPTGGWLWRIAGHQFLASVGYRDGDLDGAALSERLHDALDAPLSIGPHSVVAVPTIGMAVFPVDAHDAATLLARAEQALQRVRRSRVAPGPPLPRSEADLGTPGIAALGERFVEAMENGEFRLFFQPVVRARDGGIDSVNGLLRWESAQHGLIRPNHFLHLVKSAGLSTQLGYWVARQGIAQLAKWREQGLDYINIAIHLADSMLGDEQCVARIDRLLHEFEVPATALEFEVCESSMALDSRQVRESLAGLRGLGATMTLQDFGMGGLKFATLTHCPVDRLKLDRSLLHNMLSDPRNAAMLRGMIEMGHRLGMRVTAKGVESEAQLGFLRRYDCDFLQGYLFFPPLPAEGIDEVIRKRFLLPQAFTDERPQRTLLLVDDEENMLRSLVRLFRPDGYRILTCSSVREAFDMLACEDVQVIVSDQRMADLNGTEFLTRVRDLYPETIRMLLSGYTDLATITQAINRGAIYRFLTKPWDDDELRGHIRDAFRAHEDRNAGEPAY